MKSYNNFKLGNNTTKASKNINKAFRDGTASKQIRFLFEKF